MENTKAEKVQKPETAMETMIHRVQECLEVQRSINERLVKMENRLIGPRPPAVGEGKDKHEPAGYMERMSVLLESLGVQQNASHSLINSIEDVV